MSYHTFCPISQEKWKIKEEKQSKKILTHSVTTNGRPDKKSALPRRYFFASCNRKHRTNFSKAAFLLHGAWRRTAGGGRTTITRTGDAGRSQVRVEFLVAGENQHVERRLRHGVSGPRDAYTVLPRFHHVVRTPNSPAYRLRLYLERSCQRTRIHSLIDSGGSRSPPPLLTGCILTKWNFCTKMH